MRALILFAFVAGAASPAVAQTAQTEPTLELTAPLGAVPFATGSAVVGSRAREELREVVTWAHDNPWRLVAIQGYADHPGGDAFNLELSQDRTDAVRAALIELGLDPERIVAVAYGERDLAVRRVVVRGTISDFRELIERQGQIHTPAPRGAPGTPSRPPRPVRPQARPPQAQERPAGP